MEKMSPKLSSLPSMYRETLTQSWRASPPHLQASFDLSEHVVDSLIAIGAGALGWWRIRDTPLLDTPGGARLRELHLQQVIQNALQEDEIVRIVCRLREVGVEPIAIKGWALSHVYPELGLRPYGDIDLIIPPEVKDAAYAAFDGWERGRYTFDLQYQDYPKLRDRTLQDLYARSRLIRLGETNVRVLSDEDHLALVCLHFLRHGGFRPLWLCDIASFVEHLPAEFDWDVCLGTDALVSNWLTCAIRLAHSVLGARIDHMPLAQRTTLPHWLEPALLKAWSRPFPYQHPETHEPFAAILRHPDRLPEAIHDRWWNPIRTNIWADAPFDGSPRLPRQVRNFIWQMREYRHELRRSDH